jgi:hypothetical protein
LKKLDAICLRVMLLDLSTRALLCTINGMKLELLKLTHTKPEKEKETKDNVGRVS